MSWLDKAKGMLYDEDPNAVKSAAPTAAVGLGSLTQPSQPGTPMTSMPMAAGVNPDMVAMIKKVTFGRNTAFTQLLQASEALADVIPDQVMRLKAAHKTAGAGRTGKQIADAVDVHLQDVDGEEMRFAAAVKQKADTEIAGVESQATLATQQIQNAQLEIQQAQQRIADLTANIGQYSQTAATAQATVAAKRAELDQATAQFKIAANSVRNELNASKSAILSTLV